MTELTIKIDHELSDKITRTNLIDCLESIEYEIKHIEGIMDERDLRDHEKIDLYDSKAQKKSIEHVLRYISLKSDLEPFGLAYLCDW